MTRLDDILSKTVKIQRAINFDGYHALATAKYKEDIKGLMIELITKDVYPKPIEHDSQVYVLDLIQKVDEL